MSALDGILQRLGAQPAERGLLGWAALCLVLLGTAAFALLNASETLFLKRVGVEALPWALLASSGLLVVTTALLGRVASKDPSRWLPRILTVLAIAPLGFVWLVESQSTVVLGALVLLARQVLALGLMSFWLAMGRLLPARRAKVLFAPLAAGVTVGGIVGSFGSGPLAAWIGMAGLIGLCAAALFGAAAASMRLQVAGTLSLGQAVQARRSATAAGSTGFVELLRSNRLFQLLLVAELGGGLLGPILYFEFATVLDTATAGPDAEQRLLGLYSQFRGWLNVAMLGSQLWLSAFLYRRIGLARTMILWPAAYALGFGWLGIDFALVAALVSFGVVRVVEDGIADTGGRVLYNLFPDEIRGRASSLLEGPVHRLGAALGNGVVLGALAVGGAAWLGWAAAPMVVAWLACALVLQRAYPGLLLQASADHGLAGADVDREALLDRSTLRRIAASLVDPDPRAVRAAIDLLADGDPTLSVRLLAEAIESAPAANRPLIVEALQRLVEPLPPGEARSDEATAALAQALRARPAGSTEERADLAQVYARLTAGDSTSETLARESRALLERLLGDRAAPVRLAAIVELHRRGAPPVGLPDLDRTLADALGASDALTRRAARVELRRMLLADPDERWEARLALLASHLDRRADRAPTAEALRDVARRHRGRMADVAREAVRFAEDRDPRVRRAVLALIGHAELADEAPRLVAALGERVAEDSEGAREGLVALGAQAVLPLLVGLEFGGPRRRQDVLAVLRELEVDPATLGGLRDRQLASIHEAVALRAAADPWPGDVASLLRRRLEERIEEGLGALLDLYAALYRDPRLADLDRRLRRAPSARERDLLIEAIEALLGHEDRQAIVPLIEAGDWSERGRASLDTLNRRPLATAGALSELRGASDPGLRKLAGAIALEGAEAIGDPDPMPSAMEIAVALQEVRAFDRLSTPQLMSLAALLQEQKAAAGERIFVTGEESSGLYFVLEGEVELRRGELVLDRAPAGSFFGEISALDGVPRSADAVAVEPVRLLRLERDDLLGLLEDAPAVSIGLAQALTARVRRLADRLEESERDREHGDP